MASRADTQVYNCSTEAAIDRVAECANAAECSEITSLSIQEICAEVHDFSL